MLNHPGILGSAVPKKVWMDESMNLIAFNEVEGRDGYLVLKVYDYNPALETWDFEGKYLTDAFSLQDIGYKNSMGINYEMDFIIIDNIVHFTWTTSPKNGTTNPAIFQESGNVYHGSLPFK